MKISWIGLLLGVMVFANTQPYKKDIIFQKVDKQSSLVRVKIDNEIYQNTNINYPSVRIQSTKGAEGYFIKPLQVYSVSNQKRLSATSYDRKNAKLTYHFDAPFEIEKIELHIQDRDFESLVDLYIDDKIVTKNVKIFDYSQETGNRNFSISIPKQKAKKLTIIYHLDNTTSFYKKYRNLQEPTQYLTIKSVTFSNQNQTKKE